jgi:hypothetical protein
MPIEEWRRSLFVPIHPVANCCNEFGLRGVGVPIVVFVFELDHSDSAPALSQQIPVAPIDRCRLWLWQARAIAAAVY